MRNNDIIRMRLIAFIALISLAFAMPADPVETKEKAVKDQGSTGDSSGKPKVEADGLAYEVASFVLATLDKYGVRDKQAEEPSTDEPSLATSNSSNTSDSAKDVSAAPTSSSAGATKTKKKLKESDAPEQ